MVITDSKGNVLNFYYDHIYDVVDPGESVVLPAEKLETVTNAAAASSAVSTLTTSMTTEQKQSATGADLATLYAETAVAAASKPVSGNEIIINAAVAELEKIAAQTSEAVESSLVSGGVLSNTVTLTTTSTGKITIKVDPDILTTKVDKIRVETSTYAITLNAEDLRADLTGQRSRRCWFVRWAGPTTPHGPHSRMWPQRTGITRW